MTTYIPAIAMLICFTWTLVLWPKETDFASNAEMKKHFSEYLVLDIRAMSQYCYWYLALIGVMLTIVVSNRRDFAPLLHQGHLWPFETAFVSASLALLFLP